MSTNVYCPGCRRIATPEHLRESEECIPAIKTFIGAYSSARRKTHGAGTGRPPAPLVLYNGDGSRTYNPTHFEYGRPPARALALVCEMPGYSARWITRTRELHALVNQTKPAPLLFTSLGLTVLHARPLSRLSR